jgi:hypothetical protein
MNPKLKSFLLWFFAFVFMAGAAIYQRMTGPTYPVHGKVEINGKMIKYQLIRTYDGTDDAKVKIEVPDTAVKGEIKYVRYRMSDTVTAPMAREGSSLAGFVPHQPTAGKIAYHITLISGSSRILLNPVPAVMRFKGAVPLGVLLLHIIIIFLAMLFSTRTGLEVIFRGKYTYLYTWMTVITLFIGGMILGPIVQKYSFGVYWSGFPFGFDLTDNKSLIAFIFWVVALAVQLFNRDKKAWSVIAAVVLLVVFLIPHSVLGSEHDYSKDQKIETTK